MSYVEPETMIKFKDKMVKKYSKRIHTLCKINPKLTDGFQTPIFYNGNTTRKLLDPNATYSFALGNDRGRYIGKKGNGNGFIAASNDYLHQKKKYYDETIDGEYVTLLDIFKFLFGFDPTDGFHQHILTREHGFPRSSMPVNGAYGVFHINFNMSWAKFESEVLDSAYLTQFKQSYYYPNIFQAYRGRIYIVKNVAPRDTDPKNLFCEDVYGYLHLIISINNNEDDGTVDVYIGSLKE